MIIVSFGLMKSGSTLAYEMARTILELAGEPQEFLGEDLVMPWPQLNFVQEWNDESLTALLQATQGRRIVIKTHHSLAPVDASLIRSAVESGDMRVHVTYRDPRDIVLSMLDHGFRARTGTDLAFRDTFTVEDGMWLLAGQLLWIREWLALPSLKLRYEDVVADAAYAPTAIAGDLGVDVDLEEAWRIVSGRFTQQNEGLPERYKSDLWPDEIEKVERAFPLFIDLVAANDLTSLRPPDDQG